MEESTSDDDSNINDLMAVTGASREMARSLLEACSNDLTLAVQLQLDGISTSNLEVEEVRDPIPQRTDTLVDSAQAQSLNRPSGSKRLASGTGSWIDPFRNFQVETAQQEKNLLNQNVLPSNSKKNHLEDLFRPPLRYITSGSFEEVREIAIKAQKWLMVNVQDSTDFPCLVLNRDVWSDKEIMLMVDTNFVFWQINKESADGERYNQFYGVDFSPYVSVIDPRTGELLKRWHVFDKDYFSEKVINFIQDHSLLPDGHGVKRKRSDSTTDLAEGVTGHATSAAKEGSDRPTVRFKEENCVKASGSTVDADAPCYSYKEEGNSDEEMLKPSSATSVLNMSIDLFASDDDGMSEADEDLSPSAKKNPLDSTGKDSLDSSDNYLPSSQKSSPKFLPSSQKSFPLYKKLLKKKVLHVVHGSSSDSDTCFRGPDGENIIIPETSSSSDDKTGDDDLSSSDIVEAAFAASLDMGKGISLAIRYPDSRRVVTAFPSNVTVGTLQRFLKKEGYPPSQYDYMSCFPKTLLSSNVNRRATLASLGIKRTDTVFIHKKCRLSV